MVVLLLQAGAARLLADIRGVCMAGDVPVLPPSPQSNIYFYFLPPQMEKTGLGKGSCNEMEFKVSSSPTCSVIVQAGISGLITCTAL